MRNATHHSLDLPCSPVHLLGAGGHARVILDLLRAREIPVGGIYDADPSVCELDGYRVLPESEVRFPLLLAIGDNAQRKRLVRRFGDSAGSYATVVAPSAILSPSVRLGEGTVVMEGAILQAATRVGNHVIVNTGASIDHECILEDYVHVSPCATLCGRIRVGEGTHVGAGAVVIPGIRIGRWCRIGAGAVIIRDIPDGATVVGNPGRIISIRTLIPTP